MNKFYKIIFPMALFATMQVQTLFGQTNVANGFTSISFSGQNDYENLSYWNNTNSGATLSFPQPGGSSANKYVVRIIFKSDSDAGDTTLYPLASEDPNHAWHTANGLNATNSITVDGAAGMSGSTAQADDIETAKSTKWQDGDSFQFVILTYQLANGLGTPEEHIFDDTWYAIHEEDGPHNRSTTWSISLTDATDSGESNSDNRTNIASVSFDIAGSFNTSDSLLVYADYDPDGYTSWTDRSNIYYEMERLNTGITSKEIGPVTSALNMNGTDGSYRFFWTVIDQYGSELNYPEAPYLWVVYDNIAPVTPNAPDLTSGTDTGVSNTDNLTKDNTPIFYVESDNNDNPWIYEHDDQSYALIYVAGVLTDSTQDNTDPIGANVTISGGNAISDGTYSITARVRDQFGNLSGESSALSIVVDATGPDYSSSGVNVGITLVDDSGWYDSDGKTNDTTPRFTITNTANTDSVFLLFGTDTLDQQISTGVSMVMSVSSAQSNADYEVRIAGKDYAGNYSNPHSAKLDITIDNTSPSKPNAPDLQTAFDSGSSSSDNITKETTVQFDLSGLASGDSIYLYFGSDIVARDIAGSPLFNNMQVSFTAGDYEGDISVFVKTQDISGNNSPSSDTLTVTFDTQGPSAPTGITLQNADDTGTSNSDHNTQTQQPRFDIAGVSDGDSVLLKFDGTSVGSGTESGGDGTITISPDNVQIDATYTVTAVRLDPAGNESSAATLSPNLTIDNVNTVQPGTPDLYANDDTGFSDTDNYTGDSTIVFRITTVTEGDSVFIKFDGTTVATGVVATDSTAIDIQVTDNDEGIYDVLAVTKDLAGNDGTVSGTLSNFTIDTSKPTKPAVPALQSGSDSGILDNDNLTYDYNPTFDISSLTATDSVYMYFGSTIVSRDFVSSGTSISLTSANQPNATNTVTAKAKDKAGNLSSASNAVTVRIDTTRPGKPNTPDLIAAYDSGFDDSDEYTNIAQPFFDLTGLSATIDSLRLLINGVISKAAVMSQASRDTFQLGTALTDGTFNITLVAIDSAGNVSLASDALSLTIDLTDPDAPTGIDLKNSSDTGTSNSDNLTKDYTPEFTISNVVSGDSVFVVTTQGASTDTVGRDLSSNTSIDISASDLTAIPYTDGTMTVKSYAMDPAGNTSDVSASASLNITLDNTVPGAPIIDLNASSDSGTLGTDNLTNDYNPTFTITNVVSTDSLLLVVTDASTDTVARGIAVDFTHELTSSNLSNGTKTFTTFRKDYAGNLSEGATTLTVRIDTVKPNTPSTPDLLASDDSGFSSSDNITKITQPNLVVTGLSNSSLDYAQLLLNNSEYFSDYISQVSTDTFQVNSVLSEGRYEATVVMTDSAGNVSDTSAALVINIDDVAPSTPSTPDLIVSKDLGESSSDNLTSDPLPSLESSNIESGSIMKLYAVSSSSDTSLIAEETVATGAITLTSTITLSDDTYSFYYTSEDTAGNQSASNDLTGVRIDTDVPTASIVPADSLVRVEDSPVSITVLFNDGMSTSPQIAVDFAGTDDLIAIDMTNTTNDSIWTYDLTIPEGNDGTATISIIGTDNAGNSLTDDNTTDQQILRVDNTDPVFSNISPDSTNYVNHRLVSYQLSEDVFSGSITWARTTGNDDGNSPHLQSLTASELLGGFLYSNVTLTNDPTNLVSGTNYSLTFSATDSAGNISDNFISTPVYYDTTAPTVALTYSRYIASVDSVVTITAQFNERAMPTPQITINYTGEGNDVSGINMTIGADSTIWTYGATIPAGNNGIASVSITTTDLALNALRAADVANRDTLLIDNTLPTAVIAYSDSLVKENDVVTVTVTFSEEMVINPNVKISVDYTGVGDDIDTADMTWVSDTVWTKIITIPDGNDGAAVVSIIAEDLAGNSLTDLNTSNQSLMRVDNTHPTFTLLSPDSGEYVNHTLVGYKLSETSFSGYVRWARIGGLPDIDHTVTLSTAELDEATTFSDYTLTNMPSNLVSGSTYRMTWSATDSAGNISTDYISTPVHYDTTAPSVALTYSKYIVSADTVVTITAQFDEKVVAPQIAINYGVDNVPATTMTIGLDSTNWTYIDTIPSGIGNEDTATVLITTADLATNALRSADIANSDTLFVDNTKPTITFSYENLTQPNLTNEGKFQDIIEITAQFTERADVGNPPTLNIEFANSTGDSIIDWSASSSSNDDSVWIYQVTLPDSSKNDSIFIASLTAKDLAGNPVVTFTSSQVFTVDNTPPADFSTGAVTPQGDGQVSGWYNSRIDSIEILASVPQPASDNTILEGGKMDIQIYNIVRGTDWVTIPGQDSIAGSGSISFIRTTSEIETVLVPDTSLIQGDTLIFRAAITDRVGNTTYGDTSLSRLVYDPFPPTLGAVTGGIFFTQDTIVSSDSLSAFWSEFTDSVYQSIPGSGLGWYQYKIQHYDASGTYVNDLLPWTAIGTINNFALTDSALIHDHQYSLQIIALDVARNISGTVNSDTIRRVNSAPEITAVTDTLQSFEDVLFEQMINFTDADTATLMGDNFTYNLTSTHQYGYEPANPADTAKFLTDTNVINWTPTQSDTGLYSFQVIIQDNWNFADTISYSLFVNAVNDTPTVTGINDQSMQEDQTEISKFLLSAYGNDVDNDSTELTWQVAVIDTSRKPGFPTSAALFFGNGTPEIVRQRLIDQYQPQQRYKLIKPLKESKGKSNEIQSVNSTNVHYRNSLTNYIQVALTDTTGIWWATFNVDSNYYGADHRIIFYISDPDGATSQDTMLLTILPENDPPIIDSIPRFEVTENQFLELDFADYVTDVDDTTLTVRVSALTYNNKMTLTSTNVGATTVGDSLEYIINDFGDTVIFTPEIEWSDTSLIQVSVIDKQNARASKTFVIDIIRVPRPNLSLEVIQNNAFTNFFEVVITDTISKTDSLFLTVQGQPILLDTVAAYTYVGHYSFDNSGTYAFYAKAWGVVGDTTITRSVFMAQAKASYDWTGYSPDGNFRVFGTSGAVPFDQGLLIVDSTMFNEHFNDRASYRLGKESKHFKIPVEVSFSSMSDIFAIYQRVNGVEWIELPSVTKGGQIIAYTDGMGYFRLGPKTIIVPGETSLRQNYPNPFNPVTNIIYDVGFNDGPRQKVNVIVYNLLGQHVATLVNEYKDIGRYTVRWNGKDQYGVPVSSGIYFVRMMNNQGRIHTKKMMLIR